MTAYSTIQTPRNWILREVREREVGERGKRKNWELGEKGCEWNGTRPSLEEN